MKTKAVLSLLIIFLFCFESMAEAQGRRGGGNRVSRSALLQIDKIQAELELTDEQKSDLSEMRGTNRGPGERGARKRGDGDSKGERGERKRGEGDAKGDRGQRKRGDGEKGERARQGAERGSRGGQSLEQVQKEIDRLSEVLLPHQMTRLTGIYVQVMGKRAIQDPVIAKELEITEDQKTEMQDIQGAMREEMQSMRDTIEREEMREKFTEMQKEVNNKLMGVLTSTQKEKLDELKGDEFEMPEGGIQRGRRNRDRERSDF